MSPHNDGQVENRVSSPELKCSNDVKMNKEQESPTRTNDEERSELDGGLGSSLCGEDVVTHANLCDTVSSQVERGRR